MTSQCSAQVLLNQGSVVGAEEKLPNDNFYYTYKGIPYAQSPVGNLRFEVWIQLSEICIWPHCHCTYSQDPIPLSKFSENVLECTKERDVSHHKDIISSEFIGSEDCLHLNVYSPLSPNDVRHLKKPLAVLVWVHGGAFISGSGNSE